MVPGNGADPSIEVKREKRRYVISFDGEPAGFILYRDSGGELELVHTEIDDRFEGHGLGGRLVSATLDDARSRGLVVLPFCPFVRGYIARHAEYLDLVPETRRAEFGL
jgi:uncharacterized protein